MSYGAYLSYLVLVALSDVDMLGLRRGLVADVVVFELRVVHVKDVAVLVDDLVHEAAARSLGAVPVDDDRLRVERLFMMNSRGWMSWPSSYSASKTGIQTRPEISSTAGT